MQTSNLIRALAADDRPARWSPSGFAATLALGALVSAVAFMLALAPRVDAMAALGEWRFVLKFVVTLSLAAAAASAVMRLARPGAPLGRAAAALALGPLLLAAACLVELAMVDPGQWGARLVGTNARVCLTAVPLLSLPLLAAALVGLRGAASTRPALSGTVAGLMSGGLAAALYAAHCTDDSPLFVALWYGVAIVLVAGLGAVLGARVLRW